ncbi:MAG: mechanosensitive ion channel domain-containing protein [Gammaproteobacteria bacterium]
MLKRLLNFKIIFSIVACVLLLNTTAWAEDTLQPDNAFYFDKTKLVSQQIDLLKNRIAQAQLEFKSLQSQRDKLLNTLTADHVNRQMLAQTTLDIAVAKSNLDSINIELTECQQAVSRLEKDVQELQNQLNVFNVFGLKISHAGSPDLEHLHSDLDHQTNLLTLEKDRANYLLQLQTYAQEMLQLYRDKYARIESLLKSQTITTLKERQAKSELGFEQQQSVWLQHLNTLHAELTKLENSNKQDTAAYDKLQNEIFYSNENINFTYLQMLIARYKEQIQQLKVSISHGGSITLLNKASDQAQALGKQLVRVNQLLKGRADILAKRTTYLLQAKQMSPANQTEFTNLENQYQTALVNVVSLNQSLVAFRSSLEHALQQELSARQGLPGFGLQPWLDLGGEILLVPSLTFQVFKSLSISVLKALVDLTLSAWLLLLVLEIIWVFSCVAFSYFLRNRVARIPDHEFGHINLKWLGIKLIHRNLIDIAVIGNFYWFFNIINVPTQHFIILIYIALVWLFFKVIIMMARLCLVETVHDRAGHDVKVYHQLKWIFLVGGIVTALSVFMHQLPVIYEVKDLFDRLFLLFLLIASIFLLRQWEVVPGVILPYIDDRRTYLKRVVRLLGLLIPLILLVNSAIGLFGFVNLIQTISWYESIFILVLVGYLIIRGLLHEGMELVSKLLIRHVTNGWLWTEAFLKPIDRVLRIMLFLTAWVVLFLLYGWDQQSPVVERLNKLLHYQLANVLNTTITTQNIIELTVIISLLYWAARWTREFVYRLLLSRTKDLGLRNSIAILSQYAMIVIGVFVCLKLLGIDFRALTFVATAFAFGVGLGLRDLVNNFACGFLLLLERPLRVGDTISINGYEGEVNHIGGRAVTIRTWDHMEVMVPNAEIFSKSFTNWNAKDNIVRTVISIKINRHDNPHDVQVLIHQVLDHHKDVLTEPAPEVFLKELAEGLVEFEVRYYINLRQVKSRVGLRSEVLMAIWDAFEKHGIQPPYPHHEIYLKGNHSSGNPLR